MGDPDLRVEFKQKPFAGLSANHVRLVFARIRGWFPERRVVVVVAVIWAIVAGMVLLTL